MARRELDIDFIRRTIVLAKKAEGMTSPNPLVGAVIVKKNRVISEGYHKRAGLPHAEVEAINKAKESLKGATLYVNLEPCSHFGRTPPCVDEIIRNKFKRVVIANIDPNPAVRGSSIKKLKKAGVEVSVGILKKEGTRLNEVFFKNMSKRSPFVATKTAQSLDGKISTKLGISKWITSKYARNFAKSLRDKYDCILAGVNTVIKDNPQFCGKKKVLFKAVIDPDLRIPLNSRIVTENPDKLIIFASGTGELKKNNNKEYPTEPANKPEPRLSRKNNSYLNNNDLFFNKWQSLISKGVRVFFLKDNKRWLPLDKMLSILYGLEIRSVFVEGGSQTVGSFFDQQLADKCYFFIAPKIIGGEKALTSVGARGYGDIKNVPRLKDVSIERIGPDILIYGYPGYSGEGS